MRRLMLLLLLIGLVTSSGETLAQQKIAPDKISTGAVTILTDGIADPQGGVSRAFGQLAQRMNEVGRMRVLPLMGQGGPANARDLLHLRGIDFAILNSDILAYLDLVGGYPEARRRIRYVTRLFDEKVYLIARKRFASIEDLRKASVMVLGQDSPGFVTAMTLFGLMKIDVQIISGKVGPVDAGYIGDADALLVVGRELARLKFDGGGMGDLQVLPIPLAPRLAAVYRPSKISKDEIPGREAAADIDTLQVSTLLTVFDWKPTQTTRQQPAVNFIKAFFEVLPELQREQRSLWGETDVNASVPDWERYGPADALRRNVKSPPPASVSPPRVASSQVPAPPPSPPPALTPVEPPAAATKDISGAEPLRVVISSRPPLTDANQPGGGLITELLVASLQTSEREGVAKGIKTGWASSRNDQLNALLNDAPVDIALPWETPDCDSPNDLTAVSAIVCDRMSLSDPIFQVIVGLFVRADSEFTFETDDSVANRVFCIPRDADTADFNRDGRNWIAQRQITLVRGASLIECLGLVERREADAVAVNELEGRFTLERLGLSSAFRMLDRPLAIRGIHAVVAKDHPRANEMLRSINDGLAQLKKRDAYLDLVKKHLLGLLAQQGNR